ncbi:MAG: succinate dehydrogenase cytochrome b subunit [Dysgonamonadaceae bacterium]|jgi:succinate dehydrogenase / fumarate reductase cytochrome b subunit|nr:succinate dehydrogenase cytochrome b subunit [Dysgonamonadaceae bacterium]
MRWLINSPIGRKFVMSLTGLGLVLFALFHAAMNFVYLISPEAYNAICNFLGANWYAIIATIGLFALFGIHIIYAIILSLQNRKARGNDRYAVAGRQKGVSWASMNMLLIGLAILAFLVMHMVHFWSKMQMIEVGHYILGMEHLDTSRAADGAYHIASVFSNPIACIIYIIGVFALWLHMTHGFWSGMQSLGFSNNVWLPRIKVLSAIIATITCLLFVAIPLVYLFGIK